MHDDLEPFLLGALSDAEARAFEAHLATCKRCRDEAGSYAHVMRALRGAETITPPMPPRIRRGASWRQAAAAVVLVGVGVGAGTQVGRMNPDLVAIAEMVAAQNGSVPLRGATGSGRVVVGAAQRRTGVLVSGLPALAPGVFYRVMRVDATGTSMLGELRPAAGGLDVLVVPGDALADARSIRVAAPSGAVALVATVIPGVGP